MRQSVAILVVALLVLAHSFVEEAVGQKPVQYIGADQFEPLVITGKVFEEKIAVPAPKIERCTVCNFRQPLVIVGKAKRKIRSNSRTAYASMTKFVRQIVAEVIAAPKDPKSNGPRIAQK